MGQIARSGKDGLIRRLGRAGRMISRALPAGFTVGDFWANTYQSLNPTTSTTALNDVGVGDQTTFVQVTGALNALIGISAVRNYANSASYTTFTARLYVTDVLTVTLHSWDGSAWIPVTLSGAVPGLTGGGEWVTLTQTFTATTTRLRLSVQTQGSGIASDVRIGDLRIS